MRSKFRWGRPERIAAMVMIGAASLLLDRWAYRHLAFDRVYDRDWGRLLRIVGFLPTWLVVALAMWLNDHVSPKARRMALAIGCAPALAGIVAEILKLLIRRERPESAAGAYAFRSFAERTFSTAGLGWPSSHAAVAFGGSAALAVLYPRARVLWILLAVGCALTRVLAHAHFASDVVGAAIVGIIVGTWCANRALDESAGIASQATPITNP